MTKTKYEELSKGTSTEMLDIEIDDTTKDEKELTKKELDSIKKVVSNKMDQSLIPIPEKNKKEVLNEIDKRKKKPKSESGFTVNLNGIEKLEKINLFLKKHPDIKMDSALDSLKLEKNFTNRFLYTRAETLVKISKSKDSQRQFVSQLLSYGSIALFIMLPFFYTFLKAFLHPKKIYVCRSFDICVSFTDGFFYDFFNSFHLKNTQFSTSNMDFFTALFTLFINRNEKILRTRKFQNFS